MDIKGGKRINKAVQSMKDVNLAPEKHSIVDVVNQFKEKWPGVYEVIKGFIDFCLEQYTDSVRNDIANKIITSINDKISEIKEDNKKLKILEYAESSEIKGIIQGSILAMQDISEFDDNQKAELLVKISNKCLDLSPSFFEELLKFDYPSTMSNVISIAIEKFKQQNVIDKVDILQEELTEYPEQNFDIKDIEIIVTFLTPEKIAELKVNPGGLQLGDIQKILEKSKLYLEQIVKADEAAADPSAAEKKYKEDLKLFLEADGKKTEIGLDARNDLWDLVTTNASMKDIEFTVNYYKKNNQLNSKDLPPFPKSRSESDFSRIEETPEQIKGLLNRINEQLEELKNN